MDISSKISNRYWNFIQYHYPYLWCKHLYKEQFGKNADFDAPKDINQKIQWLEFFTDTTVWSMLADKYRVRKFVEDRIGKQVLVPLIAKYDKAEEIDFEALPNKFVIKPNNGSYDTVIVTDKGSIDCEEIRAKMAHSLKCKFGYSNAEPHYLRIPPCIIVEELLECNEAGGLIDYKLWCFNGKFHHAFVCANRDNTEHRVDWNYYDRDWKRYSDNISPRFRNDFDCPKPTNFDKMIEYAEKLSEGFPQARVDFYNIGGKVYFGEMTMSSNYGMMPYYTQEVLDDMGIHCTLPNRSFREIVSTFIRRWTSII